MTRATVHGREVFERTPDLAAEAVAQICGRQAVHGRPLLYISIYVTERSRPRLSGRDNGEGGRGDWPGCGDRPSLNSQIWFAA
ncbi:hypothetical protein NL676_016121 [Syzygium grande]|nr:hypothetical protein NL676_016121 [Syzygium grande]